MKEHEIFEDYIAKVDKIWRSGKATEHTYRGALTDLIQGLLPDTVVLNEPKRIDCGAPDLIITRDKLPVAFIEAKDIGVGDLDGQKVTGNKEQFDRYKASLDHIAFSDYLEFHFYEKNVLLEVVGIGKIKGDHVVLEEESIERFSALVKELGSAKPQKIKSASQLAQLMAAKARLLERVVYKLLSKDKPEKYDIYKLMCDFKRSLMPDATTEEFADIYAQTITYGLFAARLHDPTLEDFTRYEAAALIPKSNPFLKKLFAHISSELEEELDWIVDELVTLFGAVNVRELMKGYGKATNQSDPMIHFYEDFLAAYDAGVRKDRGVWYTPLPVVKFMVRAVDWILQNVFGLADGLANKDKVEIEVEEDNQSGKKATKKVKKLVHKVQLLDPATGTGTYIAECINFIFSKFAGNKGKWRSYVDENLLPRLNGFEILMASYTMAHVKLDMVLSNTGYVHDGNRRFNVFLTNSLEEHTETLGPLFAMALGDEANAAKFIKRDCPVMVVMGNPPYSGESQNKGKWITKLMQDYKKEPGGEECLHERNSKWINDDYVKFIRLAQSYVQRNKEGVLAYINNHGFLDNPTFRGMRWNLLETFDEIYVLNLHGNSKRHEESPDGSKDENVFDITVGVSINIFIKSGKKNKGQLAAVHYADLYGKRADKFKWLEEKSLKSVKWKDVDLRAPMYFFVPKDFDLQSEYESGFSIKELFLVNGIGITSKRDEIAYQFTKAKLDAVVHDYCDLSEMEIKSKYGVKQESCENAISSAKRNVCQFAKNGDFLKPATYRPFDIRWTFYTDFNRGFLSRPAYKVMSHFVKGQNIGLISGRQGQAVGDNEWNLAFVTEDVVDLNVFYRGGGCTFPLYIYEESFGKLEKKPNFSVEIYDKIVAALKRKPSPEEVFDYIYAILHTSEYRSKYKELLKVDFPRIPYPKSASVFDKLAKCGKRLREAHLLKGVHSQFSKVAAFAVDGDNEVSEVRFEDRKVYINPTQYFNNVDEEIFNIFIGGYQPAQKWLKDRKGLILTSEDCDRYQAIILSLIETRNVMKELSAIAGKWMSDDR